MRKLALAILFFLLASPAWATTYYLATAAGGGSDSNNGTSTSTPWLTPNHAVNCGDVITAAASTSYSAANFTTGVWGTVTCSSGNSVAWLKCVTFDACKISTNSAAGMVVDESYWGVQGWEITVTTFYNACFRAYSRSSLIHHIIFANNVANGCFGVGFESASSSATANVDYIAIVGNIAYNAAQGNSGCGLGISIYQPVASDTLPGTHIFIAGNFSYGNFNGNPCAGGIPTDGEGIILDTFDGSQWGLPSPYAAQAVVDNNILVANGGRGLQIYNNYSGLSHAAIYLRHNTMWGNNGDHNQNTIWCGELLIAQALNTQAYLNIAATNATDGCGANPIYAYYVGFASSANASSLVVDQNIGWSAAGTYSHSSNTTGFSFGPNNLFGTNPNFANATAPGPPNCGSASSVPNCMATVIANFTPTTATAVGYGYQIPKSAPVYDPLFPQWLCNVNLPAGLVTMGCLAQSSLPASPTITSVKVQ